MDSSLSRGVANVVLNSGFGGMGTAPAPSTILAKTLKLESSERQPRPSCDHQSSRLPNRYRSASESSAGSANSSDAAVPDGRSRFSRDGSQDSQRLLTVDQLADRWQVSPRTIRRMIKNGQIPVIRIGRAVRIHPNVVPRG
jgi:excisionase family DNA binding protein